MQRNRFTIVFLAALGLLEAWIFSRREFFGGDALWWLYYRFAVLVSSFKAFTP